MKNLFKLVNHPAPEMTEELATMISKYNKKCTREDIVNDFKLRLNKNIYGNAKLGINHLTITEIPDEVIPYLKEISTSLKEKNFSVGVITDPYPILAIKWNNKIKTKEK